MSWSWPLRNENLFIKMSLMIGFLYQEVPISSQIVIVFKLLIMFSKKQLLVRIQQKRNLIFEIKNLHLFGASWVWPISYEAMCTVSLCDESCLWKFFMVTWLVAREVYNFNGKFIGWNMFNLLMYVNECRWGMPKSSLKKVTFQ